MTNGLADLRAPRWVDGLLAPGEIDAAQIEDYSNKSATSPFLLVCDHASNRVPASLNSLGISRAELQRHIGWDIGALAVARGMAKRLGGLLIYQAYSRLVIDCNRPPHVDQAFPVRIDGTEIPGNASMNRSDAAARVAEVFHPYHAAISAALNARVAHKTILLAIHSYTPFHGDFPEPRPWPVSLLFNKDSRFSHTLAAQLRQHGIGVGMNQPYVVDDEGDYAIPVHAERRGIAHSLIEVRQDLISDEESEQHWAKLLSNCAVDAAADWAAEKGRDHGKT